MRQQTRALALIVLGGLAVVSYAVVGSIALSALGAIAAGAGLAWLLTVRKWTLDQWQQEPLIRRIWQAARRLPRDRLLIDPVTGTRFCVERTRGFVSLATAETLEDIVDSAMLDTLEPSASGMEREATVTRYMLGFLTTPLPPPLYRHITGLHQERPERMSWSDAAEVARLNDLTGMLEATAPELDRLATRLERAVVADRTS